jgi:hypothetical protein
MVLDPNGWRTGTFERRYGPARDAWASIDAPLSLLAGRIGPSVRLREGASTPNRLPLRHFCRRSQSICPPSGSEWVDDQMERAKVCWASGTVVPHTGHDVTAFNSAANDERAPLCRELRAEMRTNLRDFRRKNKRDSSLRGGRPAGAGRGERQAVTPFRMTPLGRWPRGRHTMAAENTCADRCGSEQAEGF